MKIYHCILLFFLSAITLTAMHGCTKDIADPWTGEGDYRRKVTFEIKVPQSSAPTTQTSTRAMSTVQENTVSEVDILVFKTNGSFDYHATADGIEYKENSTTEYVFQVELTESSGCDIYVIANAAGLVRGFLTQMGTTPFDKAAVQQGLNIDLENGAPYITGDGKWDSSTPACFPMWGEKNGIAITQDTKIRDVKLYRMIARVNVRVTTDVEDFALEEVHLYNPGDRGAIVPKTEEGYWVAGHAAKPSLPLGWARYDGSLVYSSLDIENNSCTRAIYTFESSTGDPNDNDNNTFLVIGGSYKEGPTSYYRIDFAGETSNYGRDYMPLLRNHSYEFSISQVGEEGYGSADKAAVSPPRNLKSKLIIEDEYELGLYQFYEDYYLAAESEEIIVEATGTSLSMWVKSNYEYWTAVVSGSPTDPDFGNPVWITPLWDPQTAMFTGKEALEFTLGQNDQAQEKIAYVHISAGDKLKLVVKIKQTEYFLSIDPTNAEISSAGGLQKVSVTTNDPSWSFSVEYLSAGANWITPGSKTASALEYTVSLNNTGATRTAKITFSASNGKKVIHEIEQEYGLFAKSNVVLDEDGRLTFAINKADNENGLPANMQGLHFKWGSLVGLTSTDGNLNYDPEHIVFSTIPGLKPSDYLQIPSHLASGKADYLKTDDDFAAMGNGKGYDAETAIGDICRYISDQDWWVAAGRGKWRIPTAAEWDAFYDENEIYIDITKPSPGPWSAPSPHYNASGTIKYAVGWWIGKTLTNSVEAPPDGTIFLPAGGGRYFSPPLLQDLGTNGRYWSASSRVSNYGYGPSFNKDEFYPSSSSGRNTFITVRCVAAE